MAGNARTGIDAVLGSLRRRMWLGLSVFALVLAGALSFAKALPNLYQSTATVLVERLSTQAGDDVESRLQRIRQEILSRGRLMALITRFNLYPKLRHKASDEALVEKMRRDVRIDAIDSEAQGRGTISFSLSYRGPDPQTVADVANTLTTSYIEEDSVVRDRQTSGAASVLQTQLEDVKKRLTQQEEKIAEFKKVHAGSLPQQADMSLLAMERLQGQIQKVSEARAAATEKRAALVRDGAGAAEPEDPDRARLEKLQRELADLKTRFSDRYPDVAQKKTEIETLSATLAARPQVDRALPQLEQINREIRRLQTDEERLRAQSATYEQRVAGAPWLEQEYQSLSRDYASTRDFYDSLLKRHEEAKLAESRGQLLRLLDPAIKPTEALAPDRFRLAIFGLIAALAFAVIAVAAAERLDTSFHSADDLKDFTRVPVLVRIPKFGITTPAERSMMRRRASLLALVLVGGVTAAVQVSRFAAQGNDSVVSLLAPRGRR